MADPALERAHGIFRLHCLGPDHVGYLEVEWHIFSMRYQHLMPYLRGQGGIQARRGGALELLLEGAVGRRPEPARHGVGGDCAVLGGEAGDAVQLAAVGRSRRAPLVRSRRAESV